MIFAQNTVATVVITVTGVINSMRVAKNGASSSAAAGTYGADGSMNNAYRIDLAVGDTDTIGPLEIFMLDAATNVIGSYNGVVLAGYPTPSAAPTAAQIATAVWTDLLASADFSTVASIGKLLKDDIDAAITTRLATAGYTVPPTANANADALLDRADAIETGLTPRQSLRLVSASAAGELAISGNTVTIRNTADTKDRIVATTTSSGQRTAVAYDVS